MELMRFAEYKNSGLIFIYLTKTTDTDLCPGGTVKKLIYRLRAITRPMSSKAVAFITGADDISDLEWVLLKRYSHTEALFVVLRNEDKAQKIKEMSKDFEDGKVSVAVLDFDDDEDAKHFLAGSLSDGSEADITFAPPYYAAYITYIGLERKVRTVYTHPSGNTEVMNAPGIDYSNLDDVDMLIVRAVSDTPMDARDISDHTGIAYKTVFRRLTALTEAGRIVRSDGRPARYFINEDQRLALGMKAQLNRPASVINEVNEKTLEALHNPITVSQLAKLTGRGYKGAANYLKKLCDEGIVDRSETRPVLYMLHNSTGRRVLTKNGLVIESGHSISLFTDDCLKSLRFISDDGSFRQQ